MIQKKILAPLLAGAMLLGLAAPVPAAAAANKAVEIPVNFTNTGWAEDDDWDTSSRSELNLWNISKPSSYSEHYTVSWKLYIPESFMKEDSAINIGASISLNDASSEEDWKWAGYADCPGAELYPDGHMSTWDDASQTDIPIDYASAKKSNGYWVISYKADSGSLITEGAQADASKASFVDVSLNLFIKGIKITAKNKAVYFDDLKITKSDGTVAADQTFDSLKDLKDMGQVKIAPNMGDQDGKTLKLTTLASADQKNLTVAKTNLTVKVGKKASIKAAANPSAKITYTSSNKKAATVNSKGVVTGKKAGKATITVKANGKTVKVKVTVKK